MYVGGDPINNADPTGTHISLEDWKDMGKIAVAGVAAASACALAAAGTAGSGGVLVGAAATGSRAAG